MPKLIVADTSCLIVLQNIERLALLKEVFQEISITPEIRDEFGQPLPSWVNVQQVGDGQRKAILELELDAGEASAIALALENEDALVLIDERRGRRVATDLGIKIMGTLGVLIRAKEIEIIPSLRTEIDKLRSVNFRMSEQLVQDILEKYDA